MGAGFKKYLTMICLGGALVATPALAASHHGERQMGQEPNITRPGPSKGWGSYRAPQQTQQAPQQTQQVPQQTQRAPQFQAQQVQNNNNRRDARRGNNRGNYSNRGNTNRAYSGNTGRTYRGDANRTYRGNFNRGNLGNSSQWRSRGNFQNRTAHRGNRHYRFSQRNYSRFNTHERSLWRSGRWNHGRHHGRTGWWWLTGGAWYFYPQPIYPYPGYVSSYYYSDPYYSDPYYSDPYYGSYLPYAGDVPSANADSVGGPPPDDDQYWYYCRDPEGYYPYVRECRGRWEPVEPTPYGDDDE